MHYSTIFALATLASATPLARRKDIRFKPGAVWDIILQGGQEGAVVSLSDLQAAPGTIIDVDLEDNDSRAANKNPPGTIKELAKTKTVVCYFSAGSYEGWREDQALFKPADFGKKMEGWNETWLDLKSNNVKTIMEARIKRAADAGCHAIDPDNIDGYSNDSKDRPHQDGFNYPDSVYIDYVKWLSTTAKKYSLVTGLKNALEISEQVLEWVEFAVNEQCHEKDPKDTESKWECPEYKIFTDAGKAVLNIEYVNDKSYCEDPAGVNLSTVLKPLGLDTIGGQC